MRFGGPHAAGISAIVSAACGFLMVAVDVLQGSPFAAQQEPLVDRMWTLQRSAMYRDMGTVGVDVVAWQADRTLDQSMRAVPDRRRPLTGRRS